MKDIRKTLETNARFGKWTVLGFPERISHSIYWLCECDCGFKRKVNGYSLRTGASLQCISCKMNNSLQKEETRRKRNATISAKWKDTSQRNSLFSSYIRNARKRGYPFSLDKNQFEELTKQNCHYCNIKPSTIKHTKNIGDRFIYYNGIDRKDNNVGYELNNCLPCCQACNRAKLKMSYDDFKQWIKNVYENFGAK